MSRQNQPVHIAPRSREQKTDLSVVRVTQHNDCAIKAFGYAIELVGVRWSGVSGGRHILSTVVRDKIFEISVELSAREYDEVLDCLQGIGFVFEKFDPCVPCSLIDERDVIPRTPKATARELFLTSQSG